MPNQQTPQIPGGGGGNVEDVLNAKGFSNRETFNVGAGGQSVFPTTKEIAGDVTVFEGGVITVKNVNITGTNEVTTDTIPQGTVVDIIY